MPPSSADRSPSPTRASIRRREQPYAPSICNRWNPAGSAMPPGEFLIGCGINPQQPAAPLVHKAKTGSFVPATKTSNLPEGNIMSVPVWMLLGFAAWTVLLLVSTVGVYRWSLILAGRAPINSLGGWVEGADRYKRAMRAHANCIENLPVFGAIVVALHIGNVNGLSVLILLARVLQSLVTCVASRATP